MAKRRALWLAYLLGAGVVTGCGGGAERRESGAGVSDWSAAAAAIRPSVHSVWGSRPVLGGTRTAFVPVGTAFALTRGGVLMTNAHVVARGDGRPLPRLHVLVQTDAGPVLHESVIVALDQDRDLALLQVGDTALTPVRWARERALMGAPLATLGYGLPEGGIVDTTGAAVTSRYTVFRRFTAGYSSGYRTLEAGDPSTNVLEVDLFLFPGVSGGPAFGPDGAVIGVNRGHREFRQGASSYGHVIPRLVVAQFLTGAGAAAGIDTVRVFGWSDR
ncbi:MAG: S1 family peptidase [Gemmatimonadota bacterium]